MLLLNRRDAATAHENGKVEEMGWGMFNKMMQKRKWMDLFGGKVKNFMLKTFFKKSWGKYREMPKVADKSFAKQYEEMKKSREG